MLTADKRIGPELQVSRSVSKVNLIYTNFLYPPVHCPDVLIFSTTVVWYLAHGRYSMTRAC
jgi:hypothetical protein